MFKAFDFCLPTRGIKVPDRPEWIHEVKYDGYRVRVERDGERVRLITRGGYDWTKRYPWIVEAALKNRHQQFVIDGEAVILGVDGISDFNALHSGKFNHEVQLYAFDVLAMNGDDLRPLPLSMRKASLAKAIASAAGWHLHGQLRTRGDRSGSFPEGLRVWLEGLVSKRADRPYRAGRSPQLFQASQIAGQTVMAHLQQHPGPLYVTNASAEYNMLAYVRTPVRQVALDELARLDTVATAVLLTEELQALSRQNPHLQFVVGQELTSLKQPYRIVEIYP
jgi:bifunctional non-homologous end joining protein LigD